MIWHRTLFVLAALLSLAASSWAQTPSVAGDWRGTLTVPDAPDTLTLVVRTVQSAAGLLTSSIEAVEQKMAIPIRTTTQTGDRVVFDLPGLMARFEGTLAADGESIDGAWSQAGATVPLRLDRFTAPPMVATLSPEALASSRAVTSWVREQAIPLNTVLAESGFDDMQRLKTVVGDARIVALGEATHGTREFFQLKHRMLEFLVREMGFTTFAIEANLPEARRVNEYVLHGTGDPAAALAGMYFWTWYTEEVLAMVEWMRAYNADPAHTRKVTFYGFDMQTALVAAANVSAYLREREPELATAAAQAFGPVSTDAGRAEFRQASPDEKARVAAAIDAILRRLDQLAPVAPAADETPSPAFVAWRDTRQDAVVVQQMVRMASASGVGFNERDEAMAANVAWILEAEGPGAKVVLWAHNGHVSAAPQAGVTMMGTHLRARFGPEMVVFGFAFNRGAFQAIERGSGLREFTVGPAPAGSLDATLAEAGIPLLALDLRPAAGPVRDWLSEGQRTRSIGAVFADELEMFLQEQQILPAFDAVLFVETTTRARALPIRRP